MENKTGYIGLYPNPKETYTFSANEYMVILALKKQMLQQIKILEEIEQKFYNKGTLKYYTQEDIISTEKGTKAIREDFWDEK
jgi:hypothetical protein